MNAMKMAAKCRDCAKTIDLGTPAWCVRATAVPPPAAADAHTPPRRLRFDKDGEPGRKITCQECHQSKVDAAAAEGGGDEEVPKTQKKATKKRKVPPKLTPEALCDKHKGITAVYKAFPAVRFKGKGHEATDLRRLLDKYREWGHTLLPEMEFTDLVEKIEKLKHNSRVRDRVNFIRSVQQGLCSIDDADDYGLADYDIGNEDEHAEELEPTGVGLETADALRACHGISEEQRQRMERNRQAALAKQQPGARASTGAAPAPAAAGPPPPDEEEEDYEALWAAEAAAGGGGFDDDEAAFALDAEAEMDVMGDFDDEEEMTAPARAPQQPPPAAAPAAAAPAASQEPEISPVEAEAQRARERAMAEAMELEEGLEDDDEQMAVAPPVARAETQKWGSTQQEDEDSEDEPIAAMGGGGGAAETQKWGSTQEDEDSEDEPIAAMGSAASETQKWGSTQDDADSD